MLFGFTRFLAEGKKFKDAIFKSCDMKPRVVVVVQTE